MFPETAPVSAGTAAPPKNGAVIELDRLLESLAAFDGNASDAVLIDQITALERLKSGVAAAQARLTATFADSQTADGAARKQRPEEVRRSIGGQIALARHDSAFVGRRHIGVAKALVTDMPNTLAALTRGELSERRARSIVEQLACLTPAGRREADRLLAPELPGLGDRSAETRAAAMAARLDPEAVLGKIRGAVKDRHVSLRPAPDTMSRLSALLPVTLGVAVYAALRKYADAATAAPGGDPRSRGQLMADALVSAVTGQQVVGCDPYGVPQYAPTAPPAPDCNGAAAETSSTESSADTEAGGCPEADDRSADGSPTAGETADCRASAEPDKAPDAPAEPAADPAPASPADATGTAPPEPAPVATGTARAAHGDARAATGTGAAPTPPSPGAAVARCTGGCGINIDLIMTDRALFDGDDEPAHLHGIGPIPAALARALVMGAADTTTRTFIRRLYTDPTGGQLTAMDSTRRLFPAAAKRFLLARDQICRTPWCDAPIREYDHLTPHADGGPTSIGNGRCVCKACNLTKEAQGWFTDPAPDGTIRLTVPTGHSYFSSAPPPPRSQPWADISDIEYRIAKTLLWSA